ncbi:hypothetical protein SUNI508_06675 [Seiridium unicorne]|uniref:Fungal N-terminal domain-containing protein n=1 Tax=Seiridium unicorne TaxID=138068 RepID=A0ABR2UZZ8_9PEZI
MEAIVAVGVASNVVQFVDFTTKLLQTFSELRHNAASAENRDHAKVAVHLEGIARTIRAKHNAIAQSATTIPEEDIALQSVADGCCLLAQQLLRRIEACTIQPGQPATFRNRTRKALKSIWNKKEMKEMSERLNHFRGEIQLHWTQSIMHSQLSDQSLKPLEDKIETTKKQIEAFKLDVSAIAQNSNDVTQTISSLSDTNTSSLSQMTRHREDLEPAGNYLEIRKHYSTLGVGGESGYTSTQGTPRTSHRFLTRSITQEVLQTSLKELENSIFQRIRNEFSALKAESATVESFLATALRQTEAVLADQIGGPNNHTPTVVDSSRVNTSRIDEAPNPTLKRHQEMINDPPKSGFNPPETAFRSKTDRDLIDMREWSLESRLGLISLVIRHIVVHDASGSPRDVVEASIHLIPSVLWAHTGFSGIFRKETHPHGRSKFTFQPSVHRVLPEKHENIMAVEDGDLQAVQRLLQENLMVSSDRDQNGWPLLHVAAFHGHIDVCKTLISCGADVNCEDRYDWQFMFDLSGLTGLYRNGLTAIHWVFVRIPFNETHLAMYQYLKVTAAADMESIWFSHYNVFLSTAYTSMTVYNSNDKVTEELENVISDLASVWRAAEVDLGTEGDDELEISVYYFLKKFLRGLEPPDGQGSSIINQLGLSLPSLAKVDCIDGGAHTFAEAMRLIWYQLLGHCTDLSKIQFPVAYAAHLMVWLLNAAKSTSYIALELSSKLSVLYSRRYYIQPRLEPCLLYLDKIISLGIKIRPDCIFDQYEDEAVHDMFLFNDWKDIWENILSDHGIDPDWALGENEKRKRIAMGQTSAHDIQTPLQTASDVLQVQHRRAFKAYLDVESDSL